MMQFVYWISSFAENFEDSEPVKNVRFAATAGTEGEAKPKPPWFEDLRWILGVDVEEGYCNKPLQVPVQK